MTMKVNDRGAEACAGDNEYADRDAEVGPARSGSLWHQPFRRGLLADRARGRAQARQGRLERPLSGSSAHNTSNWASGLFLLGH